jgi:uncharacterized RDD family membrane protein YckC
MAAPDQDGRYAPPLAAVADVEAVNAQGLRLATRTRRFWAAMIDLAAAVAALFAVKFLTPWDPFMDANAGFWAIDFKGPLLGFAVFLLIHVYFLASGGQTLGKRVLGLRIVRSDGSTASLQRLIGLRYGIGSLLMSVPAIGQLFGVVNALCIFRASKRCLHDQIADTVVIRL